MNRARWLVAAGLGIWGWFHQLWIPAVALIALVLVQGVVGWRWAPGRSHYYRIVDLCAALVVVMLGYHYFAGSEQNPVYIVLRWLPLLIAPVLLAQIYATRDRMPMSALFYAMRSAAEADRDIDISLPYALIAVLAAGAANAQTPWYFALAAACAGAALWMARPAQFNPVTVLLLFALAVTGAHYGHLGLRQAHLYVQDKSMDWIAAWTSNPFSSRTSIGRVGKLKASDRIEFRVRADGPLLLHQSSYDLYADQQWHASQFSFTAFRNAAQLDPGTREIEIYQDFGADPILSLPDGVTAILGLEGTRVTRTGLGAYRITDPPPWAHYRVAYSGVRRSEATHGDLQVPAQHLAWLERVAQSLALDGKTPAQIRAAIEGYFASRFAYSLYQPKQSDADRALAHFMLERRAGHCEYFAMATVLLLRHAGIPARLANGYSVQEFDPVSGLYLVRRRHSHAWALALIDEIWIAVDTTPPQWFGVETDNAGLFQGIGDWFAAQVFRFRQWRIESTTADYRVVLWSLLPLPLAYLAWLLARGRIRSQRATPEPTGVGSVVERGLDSEFFRLAEYLDRQGIARRAGQGGREWVREMDDAELEAIHDLHYRYRFDPNGLDTEQRDELRQRAQQWLAGQNLRR